MKKIKIDGIINGITTPYGEGADYEYNENGSSHVEDKDRLRNDIETLIQQREAEAVERFFNDLREYLNDHPSKITQRIGDKLFWGFEEVNLRRVLRELEQKYDRLAEGGGI